MAIVESPAFRLLYQALLARSTGGREKMAAELDPALRNNVADDSIVISIANSLKAAEY